MSAHLKVILKVLVSQYNFALIFFSDFVAIIMVSPGTHLVRNHESQSRTNESQLKKTSPKLKMLGPFCNQTVNLKTDPKALYYSILKFKYSPSILKHIKD